MALFVLWLGYWAPHVIRRRAELAEARIGDRFSGRLRVVAVSGGTVFRTGPTGPRRGGAMTTGTGGSRLTGARPAPLVRAPEDVETPAQRRALAEQRARRAVRARRRFVLTLFLLVASLAAWACVVVVPLHWGFAAAPSALLLAALALGRRAAIQARRAENAVEAARRAARQRATQARALANGGPYAPRNHMRVGDTAEEVVPAAKKGGVLDELLTVPEPARAKIVDENGVPAAQAAADDAADEQGPGVGGGAWDPVPVPLPTYVTKPPARRVTAKPVAARPADGAAQDGAANHGAVTAGAAKGRKDGTGQADGGSRAGRSDDASARLAAAMRASAGKPARPGGEPAGDTSPGATSSGETRREQPAGGRPASGDAVEGADAGSAPAPSSDTAIHTDEGELTRPGPRVRDETLAQPLEQILARRRAAG
ncbi:hypothetical protein [Myceligenerans xiligouense]|uniref:Uncharacterized protein n=1 Tax=Myceligenerans xiligouense TaxID=253184 RepID=A0A3N4YKQ7_9MICO|nr:hypothetical protein [Myceligenerans xiligouense]RPF19894.1 hypothetical protein EDD34_0462 [Myceligenerans xiligouense]